MAKLKNKLIWSNSRANSFNSCKRQYYFGSYLAWGIGGKPPGWESGAEERTRKAYILKKLQNRYMLAGSAVHDFAEDMFKLVADGQELPSVEKGKEIVTLAMRDIYRHSAAGKYWQNPKGGGLAEHEYKLDVSKEDWAKIKDKALVCVENFLTMPFIKNIFSQPKGWLEIEKLSETTIGGHPMYIKMDFCGIVDGRLLVVDWKTGAHKASVKEQLALYSHYAKKTFGHKDIPIVASEVNLFEGKVYTYEIGEKEIKEVEERISQSVSDMQSLLLDIPKNIAMDEECFEGADKEWTCRNCNFQAICPVSLV